MINIIILAIHFLFSLLLVVYQVKSHNRKCQNQTINDQFKPFNFRQISLKQSFQLFLGTLLLFWPRVYQYNIQIFWVLLNFSGLFIFGVVPTYFMNTQKEYPKIFRRFQSTVYKFFFQNIFLLWLDFRVKVVKDDIKKYLPEYQKSDKNKPTCFQISNHVSLIELFAIGAFIEVPNVPSFVSKIEIKTMPFIGAFAKAIQSVFVDRLKKDTRVEVVSTIIQRVQQIEQGLNYSQIHIFPEGTRTQNVELIKFQKGAFFTGSNIRCYVFDYFDQNAALINGLFIFMVPKMKFQVIDLGVFDPEYLKIKDFNQDWNIYANAVQRLYSNVLNKRISNSSVPELKQFEQLLKEKRD